MTPTNEMPTKATTTTTVHQSKIFPFVIVEQTTTQDEETKTTFAVAVNNQILSEKTFSTLEQTEKYIKSRPWDLNINLIGLTYQIMSKNETK